MLIRMGRMTVVIPFQRSSCWMAKAVSLCMSRWIMLGWRKTDCPAKTVEFGYLARLALDEPGGRLHDVRAQVVPGFGGISELAGQIDVFLEGLGRLFLRAGTSPPIP